MEATGEPDCHLLLSRSPGPSDDLCQSPLCSTRRATRRQGRLEVGRRARLDGPTGPFGSASAGRHKYHERFSTTGKYQFNLREEVRQIQLLLEQQIYVTDAALATAMYLALALGKPLLVEGPAGVGKTEVAKSLAGGLGTRLIRLQCYEGRDATN